MAKIIEQIETSEKMTPSKDLQSSGQMSEFNLSPAE